MMVLAYPAFVTDGPASRLSRLSVCWEGSGAMVVRLELNGLLVDIFKDTSLRIEGMLVLVVH